MPPVNPQPNVVHATKRLIVLLRRGLAPVTRLFGAIADIGTEGYDPDARRRLKIINVFSSLVIITTLIYAVQIWASGDEKMMPVVYLNVALALVVGAVPLMHRFNDMAGGLLLVVAEFGALVGFTSYFGRSAGAPLQYVVAAAAPFVIFPPRRIRLILIIVAIAFALHLYAWSTFPRSHARLTVDDDMIRSLYIQGAVTTFGLIAAAVYYAFSLAERAKAETETVLRNVLPDSVVERLKARPEDAIADGFNEASVLFADITGFVALARRLGPEKTVTLLNRLVSAFDEVANRHGVEKIKTIGDAYMVASGVPIATPDHIERLASMALDMVETTRAVSAAEGIEINVRIGMAAGPMMAGVIGRKKFSYDVWGDPVNLASRLEQASAPGRIQICPTCHGALGETFVLEARGEIEIKGLGKQQAWFLVERRGDGR